MINFYAPKYVFSPDGVGRPLTQVESIAVAYRAALRVIDSRSDEDWLSQQSAHKSANQLSNWLFQLCGTGNSDTTLQNVIEVRNWVDANISYISNVPGRNNVGPKK